ncbi:TonB system biopolymer transport component [Photobacterium aphoticum]|uniref:TonB system biopolymer transport component n=1 Tax=Photobacterium aphoticum TaxID=754436 RepID=A0A090RJB1_9GAMM|nr:TonB system biopolymer transport component [Photobacterium aphoticum]
MKVYNDQISRMVDSQQGELDSLTRQIAQIDQTAMEIVPLTLKMIDAWMSSSRSTCLSRAKSARPVSPICAP